MCWMNVSMFYSSNKQFELWIAAGIETPFHQGCFLQNSPILTYFSVCMDSGVEGGEEIEEKILERIIL